MTDAELQKYWDACLIKTWRNDGHIIDAFKMFKGITTKDATECNLLRFPNGFPWKLRMRMFVAARLKKISERLWDQAPEKDVLLLRKLATSNYDSARSNENTAGDGLSGERKRMIKNQSSIYLGVHNYSERNRDTDWNVTKGPGRLRGRAR